MSLKRIMVGDRMSQAVIFNGTVTTAGQVALNAPGEPVKEQTENILATIDKLLAEAGTDKSKAMSATIWLSNMDDFAAMNEVWDAWVSPGNTPTRACVESKLAAPQFIVEIAIVAAIE